MSVEMLESSPIYKEKLKKNAEGRGDEGTTSRLSRLHQDGIERRRRRVEEAMGLELNSLNVLDSGLTVELADNMIENVLGVHQLPFGVATNFIIDGREVLIPMAVEEPSVVAAASNGALRARSGGGFVTEVDESLTVAQIEIRETPNMAYAIAAIQQHEEILLKLANASQPEIVALGGGARGLEIRRMPDGKTLVVHLIVDCLDAMGANVVNTMAESIAPKIEELTQGWIGLRILTNLADRRLARARCSIPTKALERRSAPGTAVRDGVVAAYELAAMDPYRAATHNKGIMNGIDSVTIATGNDWRAIEAGAHAFAARSGQYQPLTRWWVGDEGTLEGAIELPLALGTVGGAARVHPVAKVARKILAVASAQELARVVASVGLAQNLSALSALATEGIQEGHMALHVRSLALSAGATASEVEAVAVRLRESEVKTVEHARKLLTELRGAH